jgi:uncharacterized membrane-anchored protein
MPVVTDLRLLPPDADGRAALHDEVHARAVTPIAVPAMVTQLTVLVEGHSADEESAYLRGFAAASGSRPVETAAGIAFALPGDAWLTWERHAEHSLWSVVQPLPDGALAVPEPDLLALVPLPAGWLRQAPGRTLAAVHVVLLPADDVAAAADEAGLALARVVLGPGRVLGSRVKGDAARLHTTFRLWPDGTSRFLVLCDDVTPGRAGRIAASLLDAERYRMLALLGYPAARALVPRLGALEDRLAELAHAIEDAGRDDRALLEETVALAAQVEAEIAAHAGRFSASLAYASIVDQRVEDLRGTSLPGLMGLFTVLRRRLLPAMATVGSALRRTDQLSARVARAADLLRTRIEVTTEAQNQDLLRELRQGQAVQLRLQETVEGLSIVAVSYYVVGLIAYLAKGLKATGLHVGVEQVTALALPAVLAGVWAMRRRIHRRVHGGVDDA